MGYPWLLATAAVSVAILTSRRYVGLLVVAHLAAAVAVAAAAASMPALLTIFLLLVVAVSAVRQRRQSFTLQLILYADGQCAIAGDHGRRLDVDTSSVQFGSWLILRFVDDGRTITLVLARDSFLDEDDYRRCRRWFRWQSVGAQVI